MKHTAKAQKSLTVGILMGGPSGEDYLSRRSGEVVFGAIRGPRYDLIVLDWQRNDRVNQYRRNSLTAVDRCHRSLVDCLAELKADVIFNATHGEYENAGQLQGLFNLLKIPFTGNGLQSSVMGMDKILSKRMFQWLGIQTPRYVVFDRLNLDRPESIVGAESREALDALHYPLMVKPVRGGSSIDISMVKTEEELKRQVLHLFDSRNRGVVFAEEFRKGRDFSVGVFGSTAAGDLRSLPPAHIAYDGEYFDAKIKFDDTYTVDFDHGLPSTTVAKLSECARRIHAAFRFEGFSRTDFIVTENDYTVLEVNTHPGLSRYSIFPKMLQRGGIDLRDAFDKLIEWGLQPRTLSESD